MTQEKLDYIIDKLDLGFMRNIIKSDPENRIWFLDTYAGRCAAIQYEVNKAWKKIKVKLIGKENV